MYKSKAQAKWAHTPDGVKEMGDKLDKWDKTTDFSGLPDRVVKKKVRDSIVKKLMKHKK